MTASYYECVDSGVGLKFHLVGSIKSYSLHLVCTWFAPDKVGSAPRDTPSDASSAGPDSLAWHGARSATDSQCSSN